MTQLEVERVLDAFNLLAAQSEEKMKQAPIHSKEV
jgi:hypothetical protein